MTVEVKPAAPLNAMSRPLPLRSQTYTSPTQLATPQVARPIPLRATLSAPLRCPKSPSEGGTNLMRVVSSGQAGLFHIQKDNYFPSTVHSEGQIDRSKIDAEFEEFELRMRYIEKQIEQLKAEPTKMWYSLKAMEQEQMYRDSQASSWAEVKI